MERDMYSMAQHAVAKGYGKIEYLRAQPIALSSRVSTTASPSSACSPEAARGGLGGLVISGASGLTDMKAMLGREFGRLGWPLGGKLSLTFVLINVATYFSFGLAHRLVGAELGRLPVEPEKQAGMMRRMRGAAWVGVALAAWTVWVGLKLGR